MWCNLMINNLKWSKCDNIYLICVALCQMCTWYIHDLSEDKVDLCQKFLWGGFFSTESSLRQWLHQNKLFCYILFSRKTPKHLLELYGRSVAMFLAPVCILVALKVCYKTGTGCISSMKAQSKYIDLKKSKLIMFCELVVSLIWEECTSDVL